MGNFIARAFVKIQTKENRESALDSLRKGRIRLEGNKKYLDCDYLLFTKNKYGIMQKHDIMSQSKTSINCNFYANGDEDLAVDLFLALAEMRSELTTRTMVRWVKKIPLPNMPSIAIRAKGDISPLYEWIDGDESYYEVLTPLQFAEAVKSGAITKEQLCK